MIFHDISMSIESGMPVYKNRKEKKPRLTVTRNFRESNLYESRMEIDLHTGTHLDMPLHRIEGGDNSDNFSLENIFTNCLLIDFSNLPGDRIKASDLEAREPLFTHTERSFPRGWAILLKTLNSKQDRFQSDFVFLEKSGASFLAAQSIAGVGIDALGIERDQPGHETHLALLENGVWILEGLRLAAVPEGHYILALMPLKIMGVEALPARALLLAPGSMNLS